MSTPLKQIHDYRQAVLDGYSKLVTIMTISFIEKISFQDENINEDGETNYVIRNIQINDGKIYEMQYDVEDDDSISDEKRALILELIEIIAFLKQYEPEDDFGKVTLTKADFNVQI